MTALSATSARRRSQISSTGYLPGLDGLRAIAVIAVIVYHANERWLRGGYLGVEVFFVISGYLITLLMVGEHERTGMLRLGQFWLRRARRLLPALFVMLAGLAVYMAVTGQRARGRSRGDFLGGIFYGSNWYQIFVGQSYSAAEAFAPLRHLWSLAVEEQFYLIWPLVMFLVLRRGRARLPKVGLWLAGISVAIAVAVGVLFVGSDIDGIDNCVSNPTGYWRVAGRCVNINDTLYLSTISRASGLLLGAAFAMWWRPAAIMRGPLRDKSRTIDVAAVAAFIGLCWLSWAVWLQTFGSTLGVRYDPWLFRGGMLLTDVLTLVLIAAATHRRSLVGRSLGNRLFAYIGTRSYGLYLFHWPIFQIIRKQAGLALTGGQFVAALAATLVVTELSYRYVEMPIRRGALGRLRHGGWRTLVAGSVVRRRVIVGACAVSVGLVGFALVSFGTAKNTCVFAVECQTSAAAPPDSTEAPAGLTAVTTPIGTDAPTTEPGQVVAPPTAVPTAAPTTTIEPFAKIPPYAVGESVMQGAIKELAAGGFGVNASQSRGAPAVIDVLQLLKQRNQIGPIVVIQVGTNNSLSSTDFDKMMAIIGSRSHVYFLTVRAPRAYIEPNNELINLQPSRFPNVRVIDWATQSNSIADQLCGGADQQTHISCNPVAQQFYANMIFTAVGMTAQVKPLPASPTTTAPPTTASPTTTKAAKAAQTVP